MSAKGGKTPTTKMKEVKSMAKKIGIIVLLCFCLAAGTLLDNDFYVKHLSLIHI